MKTTFERLGGTYKQVGDYLLPDAEAPESPNVGGVLYNLNPICKNWRKSALSECRGCIVL